MSHTVLPRRPRRHAVRSATVRRTHLAGPPHQHSAAHQQRHRKSRHQGGTALMYTHQRGSPVQSGSQHQTSRPDEDGGLGALAPQRAVRFTPQPGRPAPAAPVTSPTASSAPRTTTDNASWCASISPGSRKDKTSRMPGRIHQRRSSEIRRAEHWRTTTTATTAMISRALTSPDMAASEVRERSSPSTLRKGPGQGIGSGVDRGWSRSLHPGVERLRLPVMRRCASGPAWLPSWR